MTRRQLLFTTVASALAAPSARAAFTEGMQLPDLSKFSLSGTLPNLKGKVVYLDFWASWCSPCRASFPIFNDWHQKYASRGLVILGVNVDENEADKEEFLKKAPAAFPILRDVQHKLIATADAKTMPTSFLIDRKGKIRLVHAGFRKGDEKKLMPQIQALLAES